MFKKLLWMIGIKPKAPLFILLWPQYESESKNYNQEISQECFDDLQNGAKYLLREMTAADRITAHWKSIAEGKVPFGFKVKTKGRKHG